MRGDHTDGRGFFFFDQGQGILRDKLFEHDRFGSDQRCGKIGQGSGSPAGMRCNGHGNIFVVQPPDADATLGRAYAGSGGPFHQFGQSGRAGCGGQQRDIPERIQSSFFENIFIDVFFGSCLGQLGQRIGVLRS